MKKFTFKYVKQYFEDNNCELLEKEYVNSKIKMKYKCSCGDDNKITFYGFKQGHRCKKCGNKKKAKKRKLTYEYVYNYFKDNNCELLEEKYVNSHTKMKYKCSCGNDSEISFGNFKQGYRCKKCGIEKNKEKQKHTFEYIKQYFKDNNCELLEENYVNNHTKMKYKCNCGYISMITFGNFQAGQRCLECAGCKKWSHKDVSQFFQKRGCELLEDKYINSITKMKYKCSCGNISQTTLGNFKSGKRCMKCSGNEKYTFEYVFDFFKSRGCELLETVYKNARTVMKYKCKCDSIDKIRFDDFRGGAFCHNCAINKRAGINHYNYNPNLTDEERINRRKTPENRIWRKNTYKRDNYTCQKCFQRGCKLNAHHIVNYATNKELRVDEDNGITFCKNCHIEFHKIYGRKNNNREQLNEFLKIGILNI
jgi:hypothetical protein